MSKKQISILVIFLVLLFDQILKIYIKTHYILGEETRIFGNWFIIHFVENKGMAFGMEFAGEYGKMFLSIFRIIAITGIAIYLGKMIKQGIPNGLVVAVSMIIAGAAGNIIDSAFYGMIFTDSYGQLAQIFPEGGGYETFLHGSVVDMFYFPIIKGNWPGWSPINAGDPFIFFRPVFNLADSSITIGIGIILIFYKKYFNEPKKKGTITEEKVN